MPEGAGSLTITVGESWTPAQPRGVWWHGRARGYCHRENGLGQLQWVGEGDWYLEPNKLRWT